MDAKTVESGFDSETLAKVINFFAEKFHDPQLACQLTECGGGGGVDEGNSCCCGCSTT